MISIRTLIFNNCERIVRERLIIVNQNLHLLPDQFERANRFLIISTHVYKIEMISKTMQRVVKEIKISIENIEQERSSTEFKSNFIVRLSIFSREYYLPSWRMWSMTQVHTLTCWLRARLPFNSTMEDITVNSGHLPQNLAEIRVSSSQSSTWWCLSEHDAQRNSDCKNTRCKNFTIAVA